MRYISTLSDTDRSALEAVYRSGAAHSERQRAQAILLSARGFTIDQLAELFEADRDTIRRWLDRWEALGLPGLKDAPKKGRPRKLDAAVEAHVRDLLQHPTPDLKAALKKELEKRAPSKLANSAPLPATIGLYLSAGATGHVQAPRRGGTEAG